MEKKTITSRLTTEHGYILDVVDSLKHECNNIDSGKGIDMGFFQAAIAFIRDYADKYHHSKEEDILFKELARYEHLRRGPLEQMLKEHQVGRQRVAEMERGLAEGNTGLLVAG